MSPWIQLAARATAATVATFGQLVTYQPESGDAFTVNGILQKQSDEERHIDGLYARLFVNLADFPAPPDHGDEVTIGTATYTVFEVLADTAGGCWLSLREKV